MSKVPYTINVNEYICDCLEQIRNMIKTHDFSSLPAVVERIQYHANKMESALYSYEDIKYNIVRWVDDKEFSDEQFRDKIRKRVKKWDEDE